MREGISYSESAMRSGISISKQQLNRQIVSPSEIMRLKDLHAYLRISGGFPITEIKLSYNDRSQIAKSYLPRVIDDRNYKEVDELIGTAEKAIAQLPTSETTSLEW